MSITATQTGSGWDVDGPAQAQAFRIVYNDDLLPWPDASTLEAAHPAATNNAATAMVGAAWSSAVAYDVISGVWTERGAGGVVNDLTTGGTDVALSAEQGVELKRVADSARQVAVVSAGMYASEVAGRADVADGAKFKVMGRDDIAFFEYTRISAAVASTLNSLTLTADSEPVPPVQQYENVAITITTDIVAGNGLDTPLIAVNAGYKRIDWFDVKGCHSIKVSGASPSTVRSVWVFRGEGYKWIGTAVPRNGVVAVPPDAWYAGKTVKLSSLLDESATIAVQRSVRLPTDARTGTRKMVVVSPNSYAGTQTERVKLAVAAIKTAGAGVLELGYDTVAATGVWTLTEAIALPSHCWVWINNSTVKQADGTFDNIFRNDGIVLNGAAPYGAPTAVNANTNIRIYGSGMDSAFVEGPTVPKNAAPPVGGAAVDWVGDRFGWRGIGILFANCTHTHISDLHISKTIMWAISHERTSNFTCRYIKFNTTRTNGDGVDVRLGCHDGLIEHIYGLTKDDSIALTAIKNYVSGAAYYPYQATGVNDSAPWNYAGSCDISNVTVRHIYTQSSIANMVRVLWSGGSKIHDISVNNIMESHYPVGTGAMVQLGNDYGTAAAISDADNIHVSDIDSNVHVYPIRIHGRMQNSSFSGVRQFASAGNLVVYLANTYLTAAQIEASVEDPANNNTFTDIAYI